MALWSRFEASSVSAGLILENIPSILNTLHPHIVQMVTEGKGVIPGEVLLGILGRGVPPGSPNPDPISDQNIPFSTPVFRPLLCRNYASHQ